MTDQVRAYACDKDGMEYVTRASLANLIIIHSSSFIYLIIFVFADFMHLQECVTSHWDTQYLHAPCTADRLHDPEQDAGDADSASAP